MKKVTVLVLLLTYPCTQVNFHLAQFKLAELYSAVEISIFARANQH